MRLKRVHTPIGIVGISNELDSHLDSDSSDVVQ